MSTHDSRRFCSVVLDVDSTLCGIEGIDWLSKKRGPEVASLIAEITERAMRGEIRLDDVYGERLATVGPRTEDVDALGRAYIDTIADGAREAIDKWHAHGVRVILVSGGIRRALLHVAEFVGIDAGNVHAVDVRFDQNGDYEGFDTASPLTTDNGKRDIVAGLNLRKPVLAVGDGNTDLAMRGAVDTFGAFVAFISRANVVENADVIIKSFKELDEIVLGSA